MRIVFGSDSFLPVFQGITTHIILYAKELASLGHEVMIVAPDYPEYEDTPIAEGVYVQRFKSWNISDIFKIKHADDRFVNPFNKKLFTPILDDYKPDVIHCHTEFAMGRALLSYAKRNEIPVVMTAHIYFEYYMQFYFPKLPKWFCRFIARSIQYHFFKHAQFLISPTILMQEKLISYGIKKDIAIIPTGMILSDFMINSSQELEEFKEKYPVFKKEVLLFVGRIVDEKNVMFMFEAFQKVVEQKPDIQLVYVGRGLKKEELEKKVKEAGLENSIHFLEPVPRGQLKYFYTACKLFTFPSLGETQGLVVLEAMCCKKPVIGVDAMGVGETMKHGNHGGLISQPNDLDGYVQNIITLLDDNELYEEKSKEAYEIAKSWSIIPLAKKMEQAYILTVEKYQEKQKK